MFMFKCSLENSGEKVAHYLFAECVNKPFNWISSRDYVVLLVKNRPTVFLYMTKEDGNVAILVLN